MTSGLMYEISGVYEHRVEKHSFLGVNEHQVLELLEAESEVELVLNIDFTLVYNAAS